MYFLKSKIEAANKAVHVFLLRKTLCINKDGLSYLGPFECNPLGGQKFSLHGHTFPASGSELKVEDLARSIQAHLFHPFQ